MSISMYAHIRRNPQFTELVAKRTRFAGILAAMGILAALQARTRTGEGQLVDTSLFEAGIVQTYWQSAIALATRAAPCA